uniref:Uncharacterized protein n=1 Tax=Nelumbo nucifera TaxID=4432 RepID=A0A822XUN3_NELNU|nr:TPA_asm: hypothetical protein HUJ06_023978 [Nelumbo nucifera]
MAESQSLNKTQKGLKDPGMAMVQSVVQLSGDGEANGNSNDERTQNEVYVASSSKREEMVGKETENSRRKKRRFRSIVSIYRTTKPI